MRLGGFRRARNNLDHVGTVIGVDEHEIFHTNEELMDDAVDCLVCAQHDVLPSRTRASPTSETILHEIDSFNLLPSHFEQVLQQGHVPDGAWTHLLDQDGPPSEAMETRRKRLDDEATDIESDRHNSSHRTKRECVRDSR